MFSEIFTIICALLGIIGLIFLSAFAVRWLNRHFGAGGFGTANRAINIRECLGIAQDKQLMIISVGRKSMLIGVTPGSVSKICDLDEEDLAALSEENSSAENSFMNNLKKAFAERNKNGAAEVPEAPEAPESKKDGRNEENDF